MVTCHGSSAKHGAEFHVRRPLPEIAKGVLLCDLVVAIEGVPVVGVFRPPKRQGTAEANVRRACERLARHRGMSRRFLFNHADVAAGTPG